MKDQSKTKQVLIQELASLRQKITELEQSESERKRMEEALQKSEERSRMFLEHSADVIYSIDLDYKIHDVSPSVEQVLGYKPEELNGRSVVEIGILAPESLEQAYRDISSVFSGNTIVTSEYVFIAKDGARRVGEVSGVPLTKNLAVTGLISIARNVTERKKTQDMLRESELRYRELFENMSSGIAVYETRDNGEDFIFKDYNAAAEMIDKTPREQAIGRSVVDVFPGVKDFGLFDVFQRVYRTGKSERHPITFYKDKKISGWRENYVYKLPSGEIVAVFEDITEHVQEEEALQESEKNFHRSLDESPLGMRIVTIEGDTIYANRAILDIYGYDSIEELRTTPIVKRYTPESYSEFQIRREKRRRGDHCQSEYDISIVRKDGEVRHLHVFRKEVIWDGERQFQVLYNDITERKRAEENLFIIKKAVESASDAIAMSDPQGHHFYQNKSFTNLFEYTAEELEAAGGGTVAFSSSDTGRAVFDAILNGRSWSGETEMISKSGRMFPVLLRADAIKNDAGKVISVLGTFTDITERKKVEEVLHAASAYNRSLIEASLDPLVTIGPDGRITDVNAATEAVTGYRRTELIGTEFSDYFTEPEQARAGYQKVFREGYVRDHPLELQHRDGHVTSVLYNASVYRDDAGDVVGVFAAARDITTERKRAEEALTASQQQLQAFSGRIQSVREEQRKEFAREIHDDLGGALTALKIDISFLARSAPKSWHITKRDLYMSRILEMTRLIDETIGTVRRLVTELRPSILDDFGIVAALEWQLWEFQKRTGIQSEFVSTLKDINVDEELSIAVFRIFQEILTNVARHANATNVIATLYKEADSLVLKVEDNGKGISEDDIHNTKSIGLIGMRERAFFLGGAVNFSGEPSKGTTVSVRFPYKEPSPQA